MTCLYRFRVRERAARESVLQEREMLCRSGGQIFQEYREAVGRRGEARDRLLLEHEAKEKSEEFLFAAEREYSRAFVAWVTHRGLCVVCRASSVREDLAQFASV